MSETILPPKTYIKVWLALLTMLGITVGMAYIHLGWFNAAASVSIAIIKAVIIVLYFMHLRYSSRLVWVFAGAGVFWLCLMFALSISDYLTRGYLPTPTVWSGN